MTIQHTETIQRLWERFSRDQLAGIAPEERRAYEQQFEDRFAELLQKGADAPSGGDGFLDLIGFGGKGPVAFEEMGYPFIQPDFDDSVVPSQLHAAAELYFIYQYERSKVFQVVGRARCACSITAACASSAVRARADCIFWRSGSRCATRCAIARRPIAARSTMGESRRRRGRSSTATSTASWSASWCRWRSISAIC